MSSQSYLFTSESVLDGPSRQGVNWDQISDAILDHCCSPPIRPAGSPARRSSPPTWPSSPARLPPRPRPQPGQGRQDRPRHDSRSDRLRRRTRRSGFAADTCQVQCMIHSMQSPDISMGVDVGGAGDQGMMCSASPARRRPPSCRCRSTTWHHRLVEHQRPAPRIEGPQVSSGPTREEPRSPSRYNADGTPKPDPQRSSCRRSTTRTAMDKKGLFSNDARKAILDQLIT